MTSRCLRFAPAQTDCGGSCRFEITICDFKLGRRSQSPAYAFTEHGAVMAASVLNSPKAVQMSVYVVRAFVSFARAVSEHKELAAKISILESKVGKARQTVTVSARSNPASHCPAGSRST